ncbi:MAG: hypothetical protein HY553_00785 [Elusimicrobia bacterium]|nr:hypothetical protein [Elusimicrobiota bacterium]
MLSPETYSLAARGLLIASAAGVLAARPDPRKPAATRFAGRRELAACVLLLAAGLFLRLSGLDGPARAGLSSDENFVSVVYVSSVVSGEEARNGASLLGYALTLDAWYRLFGFTPTIARAYAATLGLAGLAGLFGALSATLGRRHAAWATALLSVSLGAVHFSRLALDMCWTVPAFCLGWAGAAWAWRLRSAALAAATGVFGSLAVFTYPGVLFGLACTAGGLLAAAAAHRLAGRAEFPSFRSGPLLVRLTLAGAAGAAPFVLYALAAHRSALGGFGRQPLWHGGGAFSLDWRAFASGAPEVLRDAFWSAQSWYLPFPGMSFFELPLLPLALLGAWALARRELAWPWLGLLLSIPLAVLVVPLTGPYPGMRRALFTVVPYSIAVAGGTIALIDAAVASRSRWRSAAALAVGLLAVTHSLAYLAGPGRQASMYAWDGFSKRRLDWNDLLPILRSTGVVLPREEFEGYFDGLLYRHTPRLLARYAPGSGPLHEVELIDARSPDLLEAHAGKALVTWDAALAGPLFRLGRLCRDRRLRDAADAPFGGIVAGPEGCAEWDPPATSGMRESLALGFDRAARLAHELRCDAAYCGPDRPAFLYAFGGDVEFSLRRPPGSGLVLELQVANPGPRRSNDVWVDGRKAGTLTAAAVDPAARVARFALAPAGGRPGRVRVRIAAPPEGWLGWDLERASITATRARQSRRSSTPGAP